MCQDGCVEVLFAELDTLAAIADGVDVPTAPGAPWNKLYFYSNATQRLDDELMDYIGAQWSVQALNDSVNLDMLAENLLVQVGIRQPGYAG